MCNLSICSNIFFFRIMKLLVKNYIKGIKKTLNRQIFSHLLDCDALFCGDNWKIKADFFLNREYLKRAASILYYCQLFNFHLMR